MPEVPAVRSGEPVLVVDDLDVTYYSDRLRLPALDGVSLTANRGEIIGIVGESGCGKSTLAAALMGLLAANGSVTNGTAMYGDRDLFSMSGEELREIRGRELSMVFQDPLTSLNPTLTIGTQMLDVVRAHSAGSYDRNAAKQRCLTMLERVGIPDTEKRFDSYQHEFSGGQRQRVMIAMALLLEPALLIADEITSALDVTLESQILQLLLDLRDERNTTVLFITHDLGVVAQLCDRVVVMYAGRAIEEADVVELFTHPRHPYTRALLAAVPSRRRKDVDLVAIPGRVPSLAELPVGCTYADRCDYRQDACSAVPRRTATPTGQVRCHGYDADSGYKDGWSLEGVPRARL